MKTAPAVLSAADFCHHRQGRRRQTEGRRQRTFTGIYAFRLKSPRELTDFYGSGAFTPSYPTNDTRQGAMARHLDTWQSGQYL
jgi:hypothetical protein